MFKLVVLSAIFAAALATPGAIIAPLAPLTYTSTVVSPATTTITNQASSVVHPSPLLYSSPIASVFPGYAHYIKKRSAPLAVSTYIAPSSYITPVATTYHAPIATTIAATPIATSYAPFYRTSPLYTTAHFIKKRSAFLVPSTYVAPTYTHAPFVSTYAAASPIISTRIVSHAPIAYTSHFIKKRSLAIPYFAPAAYSHTSRVDIKSTPAVSTYTTYQAPIVYSNPIITY